MNKKEMPSNKSLSRFSKVESLQLRKKKIGKNEVYLFKKKEKHPDSFKKVEKNIENWHSQEK